MMTHHDTNTHRALPTELLDLALNRWLLFFYTVLSIIGLSVTSLSDIAAVGYAMYQRYLDAYGNFTGNWVVLVGVSLFSLYLYWGMGLAWKQRRRALAAGLYLFILLVLAVTLWPVELDRSQELWDSALDTLGLADAGAPLWILAIKFCFLAALDLLWAVVFTMGGLAFIYCKDRFAYYMRQWKLRAEMIAKRAQHDRADAAADDLDARAQWVAHVKGNLHALGRHVFRLALDQECAAVTTKRDACLQRARAVTTSAGDAAIARAEADKLTAWLEACGGSDDRNDTTAPGKTGSTLRPLVNVLLVAVALGAMPAAPAFAQTATPAADAFFEAMAETEQERHAGPWETALAVVVLPVGLLLAVRASQMARRCRRRHRSAARVGLVFGCILGAALPLHAQSPAELCDSAPRLVIALDQSSSSPLRSPDYVAHVSAELPPLIDALPMCAKVIAFTFGDGRVLPTMYRDTVLARRVRGTGTTKAEIARQVRALVARMPAMIKEHPQERSEILGAFADMVRLLNPRATGNRLVMVSDGAESSLAVNCEGRRACKLPPPSFSLKGVNLSWYGIGAGMEAGRAATISHAFEGWFKQAGLDVKAYQIVGKF